MSGHLKESRHPKFGAGLANDRHCLGCHIAFAIGFGQEQQSAQTWGLSIKWTVRWPKNKDASLPMNRMSRAEASVVQSIFYAMIARVRRSRCSVRLVVGIAGGVQPGADDR